MDRRTALRLLLAAPLFATPLLACGRAPVPAPADPRALAIARALAWLQGVQAQDGRIPSSTYGTMRVGHATTALVAVALTGLGGALPADGAPVRDRALAWLGEALARGPLGLDGPALDYPVYATALAVRALVEAGRPEQAALGVAWLLDQQLLAGWQDYPAHGGFGMGRAPQAQAPAPPFPGHVDLSMTRRAVQALAALRAAGTVEPARVDTALAAAAAFTRRCRAGDGGFVYSPAELALNKSALVEGAAQARSPADHRGYGSATADALLALTAAGVAAADPDLQGGWRWLAAHHRVDRNPGLEDAPIAAYGPAMRFYYRAAAAEALVGAPEVRVGWQAPAGWKAALVAALMAEQGADGAWRSEVALQKEDDPVIATGLVLVALGAAA